MIYTKNDYEKFISRLHKTYKKEVSKDDFLKLIKLIEKYKGIVLDVGYGAYIFEIENNKYIKWILGKETILNKDEAINICNRYWFDLSFMKIL